VLKRHPLAIRSEVDRAVLVDHRACRAAGRKKKQRQQKTAYANGHDESSVGMGESVREGPIHEIPWRRRLFPDGADGLAFLGGKNLGISDTNYRGMDILIETRQTTSSSARSCGEGSPIPVSNHRALCPPRADGPS